MRSKKFANTHWFDISSTGAFNPHNIDFLCTHCHQHVSANAALSGVFNRNHCPYCLWSRHLDWRKPGDRMAACKGKMRPIGLTAKRTRNKYATSKAGELMIIHLCTDCGKVSINRLAADDDHESVLELFDHSCTLDNATRGQLYDQEIHALESRDSDLVFTRLYGKIPVQ